MKIIQKRASDLKDKYVGETEKRIAAAFAQAADQNAILVFDEADSFLRSRTSAQTSWEVSAVNEMLTQMENSQVPFICTTNLMKDIDNASLRRFLFKIKCTKKSLTKTFFREHLNYCCSIFLYSLNSFRFLKNLITVMQKKNITLTMAIKAPATYAQINTTIANIANPRKPPAMVTRLVSMSL